MAATLCAPRGLALALTLAVSITCAEPVSPIDVKLSRAAPVPSNVTAGSSAISVSLNQSINVGDTTTAQATVNDPRLLRQLSKGRTIAWTTTDTNVAIVQRSTGLVRGLRGGSTNVVATLSGVSGSAALTVDEPSTLQPPPLPPPPLPVASVTVSLTAITIVTGGSTQATAQLRDANGTVLMGRAIVWSSSNASIATVNTSGTVSGVAPGSVNVVATSEGVTGSAALTVTAPPPPPPPPTSLLFQSDWRTAEGTSAAAVSDGGKWNLSIDGGPGSTLANRREVVAGAGLGFPSDMATVLKIRHPEVYVADSWWNVLVVNGWALPSVGGSLYRRIYFRHDIGGTATTSEQNNHTVSTGPPGSCPYTWGFQFKRVGSAEVSFSVSTTVSPNQHVWTLNKNLSRQATYRYEDQLIRVSADTWILHIRLYDSAGTLIAEDADFICTWHGTHTLASYGGNVTSVPDCYRNLMFGQQQIPGSGSTDSAHDGMFYGGVAVGTAGWIGPYVRQ